MQGGRPLRICKTNYSPEIQETTHTPPNVCYIYTSVRSSRDSMSREASSRRSASGILVTAMWLLTWLLNQVADLQYVLSRNAAAYCEQNDRDGTVDLLSNQSWHFTFPRCARTFRIQHSKLPPYCCRHDEDGVVHGKTTSCLHAPRAKRPAINADGRKLAAYCTQHAEPLCGMVNVRNTPC